MIHPGALSNHLHSLAHSPVISGGLTLTACETWPPPFLSDIDDIDAYRADLIGDLAAQLTEEAEGHHAVVIALSTPYETTATGGRRVLRRDAYAVPLVTLPHLDIPAS